jgi:hypothetical protein
VKRDSIHPDPGRPPRVRPGWVRGIFIFYVISTAWGLLARALIQLGVYPLPEEQLAILRNQSTGSVLFGMGLTILSLVAATWLWLLRKRAFELFVAALALSIASVIWQLFMGGPLATLLTRNALVIAIGFFGLIVGWGISVAICLYAWRLRQRGVLQ